MSEYSLSKREIFLKIKNFWDVFKKDKMGIAGVVIIVPFSVDTHQTLSAPSLCFSTSVIYVYFLDLVIKHTLDILEELSLIYLALSILSRVVLYPAIHAID